MDFNDLNGILLKIFLDLCYFYLYLQHILGATKFGISCDPLGGISSHASQKCEKVFSFNPDPPSFQKPEPDPDTKP